MSKDEMSKHFYIELENDRKIKVTTEYNVEGEGEV